MLISLISAIEKNNTIGLNNSLLWHLPEDLKYFKTKTLGHFVLMGRKTYQSLGKKLKDRKIIVVTRDSKFQDSECVIVNSIDEGLEYAKQNGEAELFICGGEQIYTKLIIIAERLYITHVNCELKGDTFFPNFQLSEWKIMNSIFRESDNKHQYSFKIVEYERTSSRK